MSSARFRAPLSIVVGIGLIVRLGLLFSGPWDHPERAAQADTGRYFVLAENIRQFGTFGKHEEEGVAHRAIERVRQANGTLPPRDANGLRPEGFRTPGYPIFIALIDSVFGDRRFILLVQCVLGGLMSAAVVVLAARAGAGQKSALAAGLIWALHPALVVHDNYFLSEGLFNALCLAGVLCAGGRGLAMASLAGVLIGTGALVRPLGLLYLPMAVALAWSKAGAEGRGPTRARKRGPAILAIVVLAVLPSFAWAWRNYSVGEGFRVSTVGDHNLMFYALPFSMAEERGQEWGQLAGADYLAEQLRQRVTPREDVSSASRRFAIEELRKRPTAAIRVHLKSWAKLMLDHGSPDLASLLGLTYSRTRLFSVMVLREQGELRSASAGSVILASAWMALNIALVGASLFGAFVAVRRRHLVGLATTFTLGLFLIATGAVGLERLRLPMLFPMLVLLAIALSRGITQKPTSADFADYAEQDSGIHSKHAARP